ncbi:MAG: InlB B-repeat-containing protein [Limisphaerales bacterium]
MKTLFVRKACVQFLLALLVAADASAATALRITTKTLPNATVGAAYAQTLAATGGQPPYTWAIQAGGLPDLLTLNPATGQVAGMPTASGSWVFSYPFQAYIKVTDSASSTAYASFTMHVLPAAPPSVQTYVLTVVSGTGGGSYAANATVSITANAAPAGQAFKSWTGATVANPLAASTTLVMPAAAATVTATYAPVVQPLAITKMTLPNAVVGTPYSEALAAAGGQPPYTWAIQAGGLPDLLTLNPATGQITGMPTASGSWVFSYPFQAYVKVTDSVLDTAFASFSMAVVPGPNTYYTLTVVNGSGGGFYLTNSTVSITANAAPAGQVFLGWSGAAVANPSSATTTLVMPGSNVTVTATYGAAPPPIPTYALTVVNGTGGGSYAANATVSITANPAPAGQVFQNWTGGTVANALSPSTTLVMPANNVTVTANYGSAPPSVTTVPQPVTGHPRLWITPADLPRLQSWAVPSNPIYQDGIVVLLGQCVGDFNTQFFPNGAPNPVYPDFGDSQGYTGLLTEQYMLVFALNALIDPSPTARMQYAQHAHDLMMYAMNQAVQGPLAGAPFRDPSFPIYNRASFTSEAWPLTVDWLYNATNAAGQPILTAQDKATIRSVFMTWASECLTASTTGGDSPQVVGAMNDPVLLPGGNAYRMAANNYYQAHARLLTMMALCLDPADDPPVNPGSPPAALGNSLRSYILDATGAWLYQQFAMFGDPAVVQSAYGLPATASVGLASGGLPPEGMLYGDSVRSIVGELLALKTAGFADPALSGPQAALANNAPVWDRFVTGFISSLVPAQQTPSGESWLGPVYEFASYGDILRMYATPDMVSVFGVLSLLDRQNADLSRLNAERWFAINAVQGGAPSLLSRVQNPWTWGVQDSLFLFLLLDPAATTTDPRPGYPTAFYDAGQGRLVDRTDWSPAATLFDFRCSWESINHQQGDANQFEFYRNGEWLTKGVANYDDNDNGQSSDYHNTLTLQNWCANGTPANLDWETAFWTNGSQWPLALSAGDPTTYASVQPAYSYAFGDATPLYNRPSYWTPANAALDILHASRSIIWLKPDHIVVYDRARSHTAGLFKQFNLAFPNEPTLNGNLIQTTTPGGQNLFVSSLLPASSTFTQFPIAGALTFVADLEPCQYRIVIQDPANPTDERFLHVLQGADAGVQPDNATLVQSTSGTPMDGAVFANTVVLFVVDATTLFTGATYTVPANVTQHFITGCVPDAFYNVSSSGTANGLEVTIVPANAGSQADAAGVLPLNF